MKAKKASEAGKAGKTGKASAKKTEAPSLSLRALFLGAVLSILVGMYSAYAGLKVGGVYWPIVTTSLISLAVLMLLGKTSRQEIVVMQTAGSTGGLLAAGVIFTIPAIWMLGLNIGVVEITLACLVGGVVGVIFTMPLRKQMIEEEKLPYPDGMAAASLIKAGDAGGKKARTLLYSFGVGAVFAFARDALHAIPSFVNLESLKASAAKVFSLGSSVSLIPFAGGYLIGPRFTGAWFAGAVVTYFILVPYFLFTRVFVDKTAALVEFAKPLGIGIVIGSALAFFLLKGIPAFTKMLDLKRARSTQTSKLGGLALIACVGVLTIITGMNLVLSVIAIVGSFLMAYVGARVTGELNVDPMEIFAMIVLIAAKLAFGFNAVPLVILAAVVCIAAGMAGDFMQDLKAGYEVGANPRHQLVSQLVGVVSASLVLGVVLIALQNAYGIGSINLPAPQAIAVKEIVAATSLSTVLLAGIVIGAVLTALAVWKGFGMIAVALGIGMYVPIELSLPMFAGGLIRLIADKRGLTESGRLTAAGLISGEGLVGVLLALLGLATGFVRF